MGQNIESEGQRVGVPHEDLDPQPEDSVFYSVGSKEPQGGFSGGGTPQWGLVGKLGVWGQERAECLGQEKHRQAQHGWGNRGQVGRA